MAFLRIIGNSISEIQLDSDQLTIGRNPSVGVTISDQAVSGKHAQIEKKDSEWFIKDLHSRNGTLVNETEIQSSVRLSGGDEIRVGSTKIVFEDSVSRVSTNNLERSRFLGSELFEEGLPSLRIDDSEYEFREHDSAIRGFPKRAPARTTLEFETQASMEEAFGERHETLADTKVRIIQNVSEKLIHIFDLKELMNEIMTIVMEQTEADKGVAFWLDGEKPVPIVARGYEKNDETRISQTVLNKVLKERKGVSFDLSDKMKSLEELEVFSTMCVPLWIGQEFFGLLSLSSTRPDRSFTLEDLELLAVVAHQAAIGIEKARLFKLAEKERRHRDYVSHYLDDRLAEKIAEQSSFGPNTVDPLAPAEKEVTVMFTDIVSFTKISEPLSPTQVADFLRVYLTKMTDVIIKHEGIIDKYIGDAIMALFGAPTPSGQNDAVSAVRAALEMLTLLKQITIPGAQQELRIRIGVKTGRVLVGNLGSDRRKEYTAVGDTVNVAARLQTFGRPNEICVDEVTYALLGNDFEVEAIGSIDVKNRAEPVQVYKILREKQ